MKSIIRHTINDQNRSINSLLCWLLVCCLLVTSGLAHASTEVLWLNNGTTERVVVSHDPQLNPVSAISIEAWIRPSTIAGFQTVVGKGFGNSYWLGIGNGRVRFWNNGAVKEGISVLPVSEWSHIAVTYDGAMIRMYVNGVLDASWAVVGSVGINSAPLGIGGEGGSASFPDKLYPFSGLISEVRLWSYARSELQLRETMYQQITSMAPGLIAVWPLEGGPEDRFGVFNSVLAPGANFSGLNSPPLPHEPLRIRSAAAITQNGDCSDAGYSTATTVPGWYEDTDRLLIKANPQKIKIGADANYIYICLPQRKQLNDSIYSVQIDADNDGDSRLDGNDRRFQYWPGNSGLTTSTGKSVKIGNVWVSSWSSPVANPAGLAAAEDLAVEFTAEFEMRIPRSLITEPSGLFRLRVLHNFLVAGPDGEHSVLWPVVGGNVTPSTWQEVVVDLTAPPLADSINPTVSVFIDNPRPRFFEGPEILAIAADNIDLDFVEILVDGVVVESQEYEGDADILINLHHDVSYPVGRHNVVSRAFDHAGNETRSYYKAFRVDVDGEPPRIGLLINPREPNQGESVTITALAIDASGVRNIEIRSLLGGHLPTAKSCEFPPGEVSRTCVWTIDPGDDLGMVRLMARAIDDEGYSKDTTDHVVYFGNNGPDSDDDGLSDFVESTTCTSASNPDSDNDGLSDGWESFGIQFDDGSVVPLPDYGANPCYKNLFFQLDWETGAQPPVTGIDNMVNQYRDRDVTVYIETNERPPPTAYDQSHIGALDAVYQQQDGEYYFDPKRNWAFYYGYERNLAGRSGAWGRFFSIDHYSGTHGYCDGGTKQGKQCRGDFECDGGASCALGCTDGTNEGSSCAVATDCPMDDGSFASCTQPCVTKPGATGAACPTIGDLGYRLFHELGHSVGLGHGGMLGTLAVTSDGGFVTTDNQWNDENYKPHQVSVMNYWYSQGLMCVMPLPEPIPAGYIMSITSEITFMDDGLGTLDETDLSESESSPFATALRAQDCSHVDPSAFPVFKYTCTILDTQMEVISNGSRTLASRPKDGSWTFDVPPHAAGIDWNCNGVIDAGSVAENINAAGKRNDGFSWDQTKWLLDNSLQARTEFPLVPRPLACQNIYAADCNDRAKSCYKWPTNYQADIPDLASGKAVVDCRDVFLAERGSHKRAACRGGSDNEFGTGVCPSQSLDTPLASLTSEQQLNGWDDWSAMAGESIEFDPTTTDPTPTRHVPGVEQCDMEDNDGDGEIDENCRDNDLDGYPDVIDNCKNLANPDQADRDGDHLGDACQFPQIENLAANWDGANTVNLNWTNDGVPLKGVVIYRYGELVSRALFRGSDYPSANGSSFADTVNAGDTYTYVVRPLNLNGQEGTPVTIQVQVDIDNTIFKDSFESP